MLNPALVHIKKLLRNNTIPPLEGDLAKISELREIHDEIKLVREILSSFSTKHEEDLSELTKTLRGEIESRSLAMEALQKSELRFKYLANHDSLTGALNRRSFMERALQELNNAFRHKIPCGAIMIDIDHFKNFNDTYGHPAGDEALRHVVKIIADFSRKHDFLGRYGGEEFIFFFCHANMSTSLVIAERIREALEKNPVQLDIGPIPLTASFGVAMAEKPKNVKYDKLHDYLDILINNADVAMYRAKREGRNRVIVFNEEAYVNSETGSL